MTGVSAVLRIARFDPTPCGFPPPRVPLLPRGGEWGDGGPGSIFLGEGNVLFSRGRYALRSALDALEFGCGDVLLAPSYHCRTMLDPALDLGGNIALYPLTPSLEVCMGELQDLVRASPGSFKALLLPHYFGFPQVLTETADFCRRHGIALIEDCSHAFFGASDLGPVGSVGDYAIASPYKFFPCEDGGILRRNGGQGRATQEPRLPSRRDWKRELQAALALLKQCFGHSKPAVLPETGGVLAALPPRAVEQEEVGAVPSCHYMREEADLRGTHASAWIMDHTDRAHLAEARRDRFAEWLSIVADLPRCRPLLRALPEGVVPYMFPLFLDNPETDFYHLKQMGMPIWRWDDMAVSSCPTAAAYRKCLIHLPCHQSLRAEDMEWMRRVLELVLSPRS